ncbi:PAS domain S-box protein [Methylotuvimicrobium sp. KM1]|uniref:PAS domain S-box protein n=1 Tax=Methylotuvimicrobium sp. KM1 TaxID=3377707 RepID=UPI00384E712F
MIVSGALAILQNAALLLTIALAFDMSAGRFLFKPNVVGQILIGSGLALIGTVIMLTPWYYQPGIIFDTRSVLLSISGLFFGTIPTAVAMAGTAALRLYQGGIATWTGVSVIIVSGLAGILWRHFRPSPLVEISGRELWLFGLLVHVLMLALMLVLPYSTAIQVLADIALPVLTIYPLAVVMLGSLMIIRLRRDRDTAELRESETRFRTLFEQAAAGVAQIDIRTGRFMRINRRFCDIVGYTRNEMEHLTYQSITHPEDLADDNAKTQRLLAGEIREFSMEKRYIHKKGHSVWVNLTVSPLWEQGRSPNWTVAIVIDITKRKQAEQATHAARTETEQLLKESDRQRLVLLSLIEDQKAAEIALKESETRYRSLANNGRVLIWSARLDKMCDYFNEPWRQFTGRTLEQEWGFGWAEGVHTDDYDRCVQVYNESFDKREKFSIVYRLRRHDGEYRWIIDDGVPRYDHKGDFVGYLGYCLDITERIEAEQEVLRLNAYLERRVSERTAELEQANKELESFSYSVSHDLRAPLRAINGFAQILARRHSNALNDEGRHYLDNVIEAGNRMSQLIEDLLEYSRTGRRAIQMSPIDLSPLLKQLSATFAERMTATQASLEIIEPLASPIGDVTLIGQILSNLLDNALIYRKPDIPPKITISSRNNNGRVIIQVTDNGIGIEPEYYDKIFQVFQRLHSEDEYPGTGIGLAIVAKSARMMGGSVEVESTPGNGSTFSVRLPVAN